MNLKWLDLQRFKLQTYSLIFIKDGIITPVRVNSNEIAIYGGFEGKVVIKNTEWTILKLTEIKSNNFLIKFDTEETILKSIPAEIMHLLKQTSINKFVLFKSGAVISIENPSGIDIKIIRDSKLLSSISIVKHLHYKTAEAALKEIKKLPKELSCEFVLKTFELIESSNKKFWNYILKFREASFHGINDKKIFIQDKIDKFHKENSTAIYIKVRFDYVEKIININMLSNLLLYCNWKWC